MDRFLIMRPGEATAALVEKAVQKYKDIFVAEVTVEIGANASKTAALMERGMFTAIFVEGVIPKEEIATLMGAYLKMRTKPLLIVAGDENRQRVRENVPKHMKPEDVILDAGEQFTPTFVYDCVRFLLASDERKIDMRIFRSIITSVVNVIESNSGGVKLAPQRIVEAKPRPDYRDLTAVLVFSGDGMQGSLVIATSLALVRKLAINIFGEATDLALLEDFLAEMANQIFGVVNAEMAQFSYQFTASANFVVGGPKAHRYEAKSLGQYYVMPFAYEGETLEITFCYEVSKGDASPLLPGDARGDVENNVEGPYDLRLVNRAREVAREIVAANADGMMPRLYRIAPQPPEGALTNSLNVLHGYSPRGGGYTLALEAAFETAGHVIEKMLGTPRSDLDPDMVNDVVGELANQIGSKFRQNANALGYHYPHIFHSNFCGLGPINMLNKSRGTYVRLEHDIDTRPFTLMLGIDRSTCPAEYDLGAYLKLAREMKIDKAPVVSPEVKKALAAGAQFNVVVETKPAPAPLAADNADLEVPAAAPKAKADDDADGEKKDEDLSGLLF